jgi:hypothetical protein
MSSSILDVLQLGRDSRQPLVPFELALEELELALESHKKAIRVQQPNPKNPVIGVPPGTVLLNDSTMDDGSNGLVEEGTEDEETQQHDDSSAMDDVDVVGELDDSGDTIEASEFV